MKLGKTTKELINQHIENIENASSDEKARVIVQSMQEIMEETQKETIQKFQSQFEDVQANKEIAAKYGLRQLTTTEKEFIQKITDPKQMGGAFPTTDDELLLPESITSYIFEDIRVEHPFLKYVNFAKAGLTKILLTEKAGKATWGLLDSEIVSEITSKVKTLNLDVNKLSAYAFIPKAIVALGYDWVEKYIREALTEAIVEGLEEGAISGTGKDMPIGIDRQLTGAVDGVYKKRTALPITDFSITSLGKHMVTLSDDGKRKTPLVLLLVNPVDAKTKVAEASRMLTANGAWQEVFPYNIITIESLAVKVGEAILYLPNTYQMGASKQAIEFSDHYQFLEDNRVYKIVTYGNGSLVKENQAVLLDISGLQPLAFNVALTPEGLGA